MGTKNQTQSRMAPCSPRHVPPGPTETMSTLGDRWGALRSPLVLKGPPLTCPAFSFSSPFCAGQTAAVPPASWSCVEAVPLPSTPLPPSPHLSLKTMQFFCWFSLPPPPPRCRGHPCSFSQSNGSFHRNWGAPFIPWAGWGAPVTTLWVVPVPSTRHTQLWDLRFCRRAVW